MVTTDDNSRIKNLLSVIIADAEFVLRDWEEHERDTKDESQNDLTSDALKSLYDFGIENARATRLTDISFNKFPHHCLTITKLYMEDYTYPYSPGNDDEGVLTAFKLAILLKAISVLGGGINSAMYSARLKETFEKLYKKHADFWAVEKNILGEYLDADIMRLMYADTKITDDKETLLSW
jgi:hypothetical protein